MKKITKIFSMILCLAMVLSFALVASAEENMTAGFVSAELGYENGTAVENIYGDVISFYFSDGGNAYGHCPKYYTTGSAIRFYGQNSLTISAASGYSIVSVAITTDAEKPMNADNTELINATATFSDGETVLTPVDGALDLSMIYTAPAGHWRVQAITVTYTTGEGEVEEVIPPAGPMDCEIPGTLTYTFETDEAATAGVYFRWTATEAGEVCVSKRGENYSVNVDVNGAYAVVGENGYTVEAGDVVDITVYGYGAGTVSVPVTFVAAGSQEEAPLGTSGNPETVLANTEYSATLESGEYFFCYTASVAGEITINTFGDGTHNMEAYINDDTVHVYSNWDNDGAFITLNVAAGDVVTMKVYFDWPGSGTITFTVVAEEGAQQPSGNELADGRYVISYGDLTFGALNETYNYGYAYPGDVNALAETDYVTITNVGDGQFTMQDCYGRYIYMTGSYNSFNVSAEMPAEGYLWTVEETDGGLLVKNVEKEKYLGYSESYGSWGCYPDLEKATAVTLTAEVTEQPDGPAGTGDAIFAVLSVLAISGMGLTAVIGKKN